MTALLLRPGGREAAALSPLCRSSACSLLRAFPRPACRHLSSSSSSGDGTTSPLRNHQEHVTARGWWVPQLCTRAVVEVKGRDATSFLQGLTTNDLHQLDPPSASADQLGTEGEGEGGRKLEACYSAFLAPSGRYMADTLITRSPVAEEGDEPHYLIECDARTADSLTTHLRKYRLRAQVQITNSAAEAAEPAWRVGALLLPPKNAREARATLLRSLRSQLRTRAYHCILDPRSPGMGIRVYYHPQRAIDKTSEDHFKELLNSWQFVNVEDADSYRIYRTLQAVPEGMDELEPNVALPLECNLDALHGVSYTKGCYLGQELTSRVHHTGVIRKRLVPILCFPPDEQKHVEQHAIAESVLEFVHGKNGAVMLPPTIFKLKTAVSFPPSERVELQAYSTGDKERRAAGRICGGVHKGLGFALLRLTATDQLLSAVHAGFLLARPLWPPPYPLPSE